MTGRDGAALHETAQLCAGNGVEVVTVVADLVVEADVEKIMKETLNRFSRLDVLVCSSRHATLCLSLYAVHV